MRHRRQIVGSVRAVRRRILTSDRATVTVTTRLTTRGTTR